ncbi:hypothetical protein F5Y11DRAFT_23766 [Daldinia sp. FL1419]|nr:hypothetical protein F5Y11DRAFT_23766 [Daldinia sp. FL1419]
MSTGTEKDEGNLIAKISLRGRFASLGLRKTWTYRRILPRMCNTRRTQTYGEDTRNLACRLSSSRCDDVYHNSLPVCCAGFIVLFYFGGGEICRFLFFLLLLLFLFLFLFLFF